MNYVPKMASWSAMGPLTKEGRLHLCSSNVMRPGHKDANWGTSAQCKLWQAMAAGKLFWDHGKLAVFIGKWPFTAARSLLQTLLLSWYQLVWYDRPRSLRQSFVQKDAISTQVDEKLAVSWNEKPSTWMGKINPKNGCIQIFQRTNLLWLQASVKSLQRVHSRPTRVAGAERGQLLLRFNLSTS